MIRTALIVAGVAALATASVAQTPQPFPRAQSPRTSQPVPAQPQAPARPGAPQPGGEPTEAALGFPIYPAAQFIASYDAGRGQRYYIFGSTAGFAELVAYYRTQLRERGDFVFEEPPTHVFEIGRFREETMAFPPGVTIKDFTWGGSAGYPNPKRGASPERFPTLIQIVPALPGAAR